MRRQSSTCWSFECLRLILLISTLSIIYCQYWSSLQKVTANSLHACLLSPEFLLMVLYNGPTQNQVFKKPTQILYCTCKDFYLISVHGLKKRHLYSLLRHFSPSESQKMPATSSCKVRCEKNICKDYATKLNVI